MWGGWGGLIPAGSNNVAQYTLKKMGKQSWSVGKIGGWGLGMVVRWVSGVRGVGWGVG